MAHIHRIFRNPLPLSGLVLAALMAGCAAPLPPAAPAPAPIPVPTAPPLIVIAPTVQAPVPAPVQATSPAPVQATSPAPVQAPVPAPVQATLPVPVQAPLPPVAIAPQAPVAPAKPPPALAAAPQASNSAAQSKAANPLDYRRDAASHLYGQNAHRIFAGKMPRMLYAIGVLQVEVDGHGQVARLNWMRAPKHAPEVVAEIERTVRRAAPFPLPARMGQVTYTDTWLWHKSGRFQLDTLTEGQL